MKKAIAIFCVLFCILLTSYVYASSTTIKIDSVNCKPSASVDVPITISGNNGIAGAVIKISYDSKLTLTNIRQGDAFSSLTFTPPAKLTSNPITLLWDGIDADNSNGTIAILTFTVPDTSDTTYNISAIYDTGGIYDGDLNDINVAIENGDINVVSEPKIKVSGNSVLTINLSSPNKIDGTVWIALYNNSGMLIELQTYAASKEIISELKQISSGSYVKVMWWENGRLKPICSPKQIYLQ